SQDRWEQTNLIDAPEHAARVSELKRRLSAWMTEQGDQELVQSEPRRLQDRPSWHPDYFGLEAQQRKKTKRAPIR
ncbi:MAG: hypothetical protein AAGD07_23175, partial [Planctomycetota bacterium]